MLGENLKDLKGRGAARPSSGGQPFCPPRSSFVAYPLIQNENLEYGRRRCGFNTNHQSTKIWFTLGHWADPRSDFRGDHSPTGDPGWVGPPGHMGHLMGRPMGHLMGRPRVPRPNQCHSQRWCSGGFYRNVPTRAWKI